MKHLAGTSPDHVNVEPQLHHIIPRNTYEAEADNSISSYEKLVILHDFLRFNPAVESWGELCGIRPLIVMIQLQWMYFWFTVM